MFKDRYEAGKQLSALLSDYKSSESVVFALPKGGVVIGYEIARHLKLPLEIINIKKIGHPSSEEYAIGAVSENGKYIIDKNNEIIDDNWLFTKIKENEIEAKKMRSLFGKGHQEISVTDKTAIIVDDGIATGLSMILAIKEIRFKNPKEIIVAVPVIAYEAISLIKEIADKLITPKNNGQLIGSVGLHYKDFHQVSKEKVINLLNDIWGKNKQ